ncbi:MAG: sarcosine oxidase subunit gamma [Hyphomicrobiales bacterium]|nr:sarcosine oxidase subunit gamma [Hyphomicrobiales bacterium]MBV9433424.1 sarcosine oxidase subunit gamma [Hyphomicrobiales bacterium]MBV9739377.1 sarcosine oxidase subunit gamma [Hyphomicrobiales bacterium]
MPDLSQARRSVLEGLGSSDGAHGALSLLPPISRLIFRGRISTIGRVAAAFGVEPAMEPCRAAVSGERAALWLGPDEWLLLAKEGEAPAIIRRLADALAPLSYSLVDVSHRQVGLKVTGEDAQTILNAGCPLDLDRHAFPIGMCTRTLLQKTEIVLWRVAEAAFHVEVARSFAPYALRFLQQAERDL